MGSAGTKSLQQSEKAKHAANVISAFEAYAANHGTIDGVDGLYSPDPRVFKAQMLRAAAESKERRGVDVDSDLAELSDQDLIQIGKWAQSNVKANSVVPTPINNSNMNSNSSSVKNNGSHKRNISDISFQSSTGGGVGGGPGVTSNSIGGISGIGSPNSGVNSIQSSPTFSPMARSLRSNNSNNPGHQSSRDMPHRDRSRMSDLSDGDDDDNGSVTSLRMTDFDPVVSNASSGKVPALGHGSGHGGGGRANRGSGGGRNAHSDIESDDHRYHHKHHRHQGVAGGGRGHHSYNGDRDYDQNSGGEEFKLVDNSNKPYARQQGNNAHGHQGRQQAQRQGLQQGQQGGSAIYPTNPDAVRRRRHLLDDDSSGGEHGHGHGLGHGLGNNKYMGRDSFRQLEPDASGSGSDSDDHQLHAALLRGVVGAVGTGAGAGTGAGSTSARVGSTTTAAVLAAKKLHQQSHQQEQTQTQTQTQGQRQGHSSAVVHPSDGPNGHQASPTVSASPSRSKLGLGASIGSRGGGSKVYPITDTNNINHTDDIPSANSALGQDDHSTSDEMADVDADVEDDDDQEDEDDDEDIMQQMASHNTMYYSLTAAKPSAAGGINTGALARVGGNGSSTDTSPTKSNIIHMGKSNLAPGVLGAGSQHHHHHSPVHINNAAAAGQDMYASLAEQTDMRNEILMELQRQKMWSYAENAKLEEDCLKLQKQLELMEKLDREMPATVVSGAAVGALEDGNYVDDGDADGADDVVVGPTGGSGKSLVAAAMQRINTGTSIGSNSTTSKSHYRSAGVGVGNGISSGGNGVGVSVMDHSQRDNTNYPHTTLLEQEEVYRSYSSSHSHSRNKTGGSTPIPHASLIHSPIPGSRVSSALSPSVGGRKHPSSHRRHRTGSGHAGTSSRGSVSSRDDSIPSSRGSGSDRKLSGNDDKSSSSYRDEKLSAAGILHSSASKPRISTPAGDAKGISAGGATTGSAAVNTIGNIGTPSRDWDSRGRNRDRDVSPILVQRSTSSQGSRAGTGTGTGHGRSRGSSGSGSAILRGTPGRPPSAPSSPSPAPSVHTHSHGGRNHQVHSGDHGGIVASVLNAEADEKESQNGNRNNHLSSSPTSVPAVARSGGHTPIQINSASDGAKLRLPIEVVVASDELSPAQFEAVVGGRNPAFSPAPPPPALTTFNGSSDVNSDSDIKILRYDDDGDVTDGDGGSGAHDKEEQHKSSSSIMPTKVETQQTPSDAKYPVPASVPPGGGVGSVSDSPDINRSKSKSKYSSPSQQHNKQYQSQGQSQSLVSSSGVNVHSQGSPSGFASGGKVRRSPVEGARRAKDRDNNRDISPVVKSLNARSPQSQNQSQTGTTAGSIASGGKSPARRRSRIGAGVGISASVGAQSDASDSDAGGHANRRRIVAADAKHNNNYGEGHGQDQGQGDSPNDRSGLNSDRPSRSLLHKQHKQAQSFNSANRRDGNASHSPNRDRTRTEGADTKDIFSDDNSSVAQDRDIDRGRDRDRERDCLSASDAEDSLENSQESVGNGNISGHDVTPPRVETTVASVATRNPRRRQGNLVLKNANNRRKTFENDASAAISHNPYDISEITGTGAMPSLNANNKAGGSSNANANTESSSVSEPRVPVRKSKPLRRIPQPSKDKDSDVEKEKDTGLDFGVRGKNFGGDSEPGIASGSDIKVGVGRGSRNATNPTAGRRQRGSGVASKDKEENNKQRDFLSQTLNVRWCEVELLLRKRITSDNDIVTTLAAAEAGIEFMSQLNELSKSTGLLRGTLSRWLLPYDSSTSITEQCSTPHSVMQNLPQGLKGRISERQVRALVTGANNVRQLVRIKIADDNDLEQAKKALETAIDFFKLIQVQAAANDTTPYALLNDY